MRIHDLPVHRRPREKLVEKGVDALTVPELIAILLRTGYRGKSAVDVATKLYNTYSLSQIQALPITDLARVKGIGLTRASNLKAALALAQILTTATVPSVNTPTLVYQLCQPITHKKQEHLVALYVNARHQLIEQLTISVGTVNSSLIHPREVFAPAVEQRASGVILVHNHPSGDTQPSEEDVLVTEKIVEAGQILDITLIDHVIVSANGWRSLKQDGLI